MTGPGASRQEAVLSHLPLVRRIAGRMALLFDGRERDDLIGYGVLGLMDALDRFDPARGVRFESFAAERIRGAILDGVRAWDQVPPGWRRRARDLERASQRLAQELGRSPTDPELAQACHISVEALEDRYREVGRLAVLSLDAVLYDRESEPVDPDEDVSPEERLGHKEATRMLAQALEILTEQERTVVGLFYGEELTTTDVARVMGLSVSRISQIHHRAIFRLRGRLGRHKAELLS